MADALPDGAEALLLPVTAGSDGVEPREGAVEAAVRYRIDLGDLAERSGATGAAGDVAAIVLPRGHGDVALPWTDLPHRLGLVGVGDGTATSLRRAGAAVARATRGWGTVVTSVASGSAPEVQQAFAEGYLLGAYRHPSRAARPSPGPAESLVLLGGDADAVRRAEVVARAAWTARVLAVTPSNTKTPAWLADRATELAEAAGLEVEVLDERALAAQGFGGLLAVGGGSATPPRLVRVTYRPASSGRPAHVVLVGKGITYDTGGLSLKQRQAMVPMKTDMTGAAVALATVLGAAEAGVSHEVTALLALAENAVGGASYRPGDVLTVRGGTTVEVSNTDAEGRLVLADALVHADLTLDPDVLVDVATLTGAATTALGRTHAALFSPDDDLADGLAAAGERAGERLWRMPLVADYRPAIDSAIADVHHVAGAGFTGAGAITAALFLQGFVGHRRWAHLDVAGPARASAAAHEVPEGATGFGTRALLAWLSGEV
ncbi:leucyl aminopeptidase family protein [Isoptericola sp. b441]|uniref:Probable cytosol aminopeptidase n=1 Tax=Actinotalea lenta TaxID=3064654 RepID=A0ABT9D7R1_9CELL|nr:leucyl aminopeptidase family protein [Isoptericola sp. b441]MDO8106890.1 leucyl aminopeptidase family protein [Isoptericola sp. b441]